jgi:EAL domain-containing protein (putative c-di-GMP-specific phosphodiesterase class I)
VKVDARYLSDEAAIARLLEVCGMGNIRIIFKRVENANVLDALRQLGADAGQPICAQGFTADIPNSSVDASAAAGAIPLSADSNAYLRAY